MLRAVSHGLEDDRDGAVAEHDAEADGGGDGYGKRECDDQRIQAQPTFPWMRSPIILEGPPK